MTDPEEHESPQQAPNHSSRPTRQAQQDPMHQPLSGEPPTPPNAWQKSSNTELLSTIDFTEKWQALSLFAKTSFLQAKRISSAVFGRIEGPAIVPRNSISGRTLLLVIAIMTFLACLTLGSVMLVRQSAKNWQSDIATEVTIQIRPTEQNNMDEALELARGLALATQGVQSAKILDWDATTRMLEPWLGEGLEPGDLPIPRLLVLKISAETEPAFANLRSQLAEKLPNASLDDHNAWVDRLEAMANATIFVGLIVFALMLTATCLAAIFATQGALAGNRQVVEILHFVGATDEFIAREFQRHFFRLGLRGTLLGGFFAIAAIALVGWWADNSTGTPQADQTTAFFGTFNLSLGGYLGIGMVTFAIALLTAVTARYAVLSHLNKVYLAKSNETVVQ